MSKKPPYFERVAEAQRGYRWCLGCERYTNDMYTKSGSLCGPGCFEQCEPVDAWGMPQCQPGDVLMSPEDVARHEHERDGRTNEFMHVSLPRRKLPTVR